MADFNESKCPTCGNKPVWENMVNVTNGSFDTNPKTGKEERIDGYIELKIKKRTRCDKCNSTLETIYKIPKSKRRK
jgi:predicted nucleic-acid-binding Zn-ribbon protein